MFHSRRRFLLASLAFLIAGINLSFASGVLAAEQKAIYKVPVIYVTDRQTKNDTFGDRRLVEKDTVSRLESGIVEVCVEQDGNEPLADWQKTAKLQSANAVTPPKVTEFKCQSAADLDNGFDAAVKDALLRTSKKEIFVFIHGFNNSFDAAAANAAKLGFYTGCPVVLYSWPSAGKLYRYSVDECNNEWSQEHFDQFLEHLAQLKQTQGLQLNIVAHSMGNRLFVRAVPVLSGKGLFTDIYMVNPDFDAQTFVHYLSRYIPSTGVVAGVRAQLLVSRKDNALAAAEALFGGYTRLGQGVDFTLSALTSPQLFGNIWSHGAKNDNKPDEQNISASSSIETSIQKAFRVFDVTALDHGAIGHRVPHEFIAWMHYRNQAPPGFEVKVGKSEGCNRLSGFFARKLKQNLQTPDGNFCIVTRSDPNKNISARQQQGI